MCVNLEWVLSKYQMVVYEIACSVLKLTEETRWRHLCHIWRYHVTLHDKSKMDFLNNMSEASIFVSFYHLQIAFVLP